MKARLLKLWQWLTRKAERDARAESEREEKALLFAYLEYISTMLEAKLKADPYMSYAKADKIIKENRTIVYRYSSALRGFREYKPPMYNGGRD